MFEFANAGMLCGVYPERTMKEILRFAQNDKRRAQRGIPKTVFNKLLGENQDVQARLSVVAGLFAGQPHAAVDA